MTDLYKQGHKRYEAKTTIVRLGICYLLLDLKYLCLFGCISLYAVGDISCDVNGSIEFLQHTTTIDKPFFSWNPLTNKVVDDIDEDGVAVMGVDILPTELSVESSKHFGDALLPLLKQLISNGYYTDSKNDDKLPPELVSDLLSMSKVCSSDCLIRLTMSFLLV